jgi:IS605 OrfB family transposase
VRTYEARLRSTGDDVLLDQYAAVFGRALRTLHAQRRADHPESKPEFSRRFSLTARQYNAVRFTLDGIETALRERRPGLLAELDDRLAAVDAKLRKPLSPNTAHHLKRRRERLTERKRTLLDLTPRICFGSRKLFNAQHHLEHNGFPDHASWQGAWRAARDRQFFVLGSKDETAGCQGCVMTHLGDDRFAIRVRLPDGLSKKYVAFEARFRYGFEHLLRALVLGQAISYRFMRDDKGWRVFASTKSLDSTTVCDERRGVVGVDLNVDHVAISETDRCGNLVAFERLPLCTYGLSLRQATTLTSEVVKAVVAHAVGGGKAICIERLDFAKKKAQLGYASPGKQRMLGSFAYRRFAALLQARAADAGIALIATSPAYSSKIGRQKYARRLGISVHLAAAFVMARRGQQFHDTYVSSDGRHPHATGEDRVRHVSVKAKEPTRRGRAAVVPPARSSRGRDGPSALRAGAIYPCGSGGSPERESSGARVRPACMATSLVE